ncbi:ROK family protein [Paenibacillus ginsengarvi]|uniref:fructokinase n=1 Tax=Paenibacillus ginsengarvi TaxID=400777 RepID=A0A3B0BKF7_9BACL|nr:ROK family protein [Paenibacillus ginsengarvi]RKN73012.1 ROK family protein [Paenibacillus ginsengarvi]
MGYLGAIEGGGTKFVCGIGTADGHIVDRVSFPTTVPEETMARVCGYFADKSLDALGVGSFGPIDPNPDSPTYGFITSTPKPHWGNFDLLGALKERFPVPTGFDLDVNAAALGEATLGAARELAGCLYITVGTGIGAGLVSNGRIMNGFTHPEMGHILVRRHPDDTFAGCCPYHGDCLEGLAAGPALERRWGAKAAELPADHPAWAIQAYYLAQACMNFVLIAMPHKIIIGGGVSKQEHLFPAVRQRLSELLNGYIVHPRVQEQLDSYIVPPGLGDNAGLTGALLLAQQALHR